MPRLHGLCVDLGHNGGVMSRRLMLVLILVTCLAELTHPSLSAAAMPSLEAGWYQVSTVYDGDTIYLVGANRSVRFAGINAPELSAEFGQASKLRLRETIAEGGYWVYIEPAEIPYDQNTNRYRAYVWVYADNFGGWLLTQEYLAFTGLAKVDHGGLWQSTWYYEWMASSERQAQEMGCNIWDPHYSC